MQVYLLLFVYVNLIYALSITFKHIGKALSVILVILQIPGSAGTYPIEMTPAFFQFLHPLLPFTYGINAMREAIAGIYGMHYWKKYSLSGSVFTDCFGNRPSFKTASFELELFV